MWIIFLILMLLPSTSWASMTLGAAQASNSGSGTSMTVTYAGTTAGRGMWCGALFKETLATTISSMTIGSDTFTLVGTPSKDTNTWYSQIAYVSAMSGSGSQTVTINYSTSVSAAFTYCQELYDSVTNAITLDGTPGNATGAATANPTVNVTTTQAGSAVLAVLENDGASAPTAGSGYTLTTTAFFLNESWEYNLNIGTAGTYAANVTLGASNWTLAAAAFKASGGGGGGGGGGAGTCTMMTLGTGPC